MTLRAHANKSEVAPKHGRVRDKKGKHKKKKKKKDNKPAAAKADRHELYEASVQEPDLDAQTLEQLFASYRKREPLVLREDFCGTAVLAYHWVKDHPKRRAIGIDLDQPTMDWGWKRHIEPAGPSVYERIELLCANVMEGVGDKADLACALNFSYNCLVKRQDLVTYLRAVHRNLVDDGLFVMDVFGGWEAMSTELNRRRHKGFTYRWEQRQFNPLTHELRCAISFEFPDGSSIEDAFAYDWRLWTAPELCDALAEVGFGKVHVLWEHTDKNGEGTGEFYEPRYVENQDAWWTYLVAER